MTSIDVRVAGAHKLREVSRKLKDTGRRDLRRRMNRGIREAVNPTVAKVKQAIRDVPAKDPAGALRRDIAAAVVVSVRQDGVRIRVNDTRLGDKRALPRLLNRARFRHRVFGRDVWVTQRGRPWFEPTIQGDADRIRRTVGRVLDDIAHELDG